MEAIDSTQPWISRAQRYRVKVEVTGSTFGSMQPHHVFSVNISETGLLLNTSDPDIPWNLHTILELVVDLSDLLSPKIIKLNMDAKVVRIEKNEEFPGMGIQIISMGKQEKAQWLRALDVLAERAKKNPDIAIPNDAPDTN